MTFARAPFLAAAVILCAGVNAANALSLSVVATTGPQIEGPLDMTNFFGFFGSSPFPDPMSSTTAATPVSDALSATVSGDIAPDNSFSIGALSVTDGGAGWLSGTLIDLAVASNPAGDDTITMLFDEIGGTAGGEFGDFVVAELTGEFGAAPFSATAPMATFGVSGSATFTGAQIPLPGGLPLLLTAFAGSAAAARWKTRH